APARNSRCLRQNRIHLPAMLCTEPSLCVVRTNLALGQSFPSSCTPARRAPCPGARRYVCRDPQPPAHSPVHSQSHPASHLGARTWTCLESSRNRTRLHPPISPCGSARGLQCASVSQATTSSSESRLPASARDARGHTSQSHVENSRSFAGAAT